MSYIPTKQLEGAHLIAQYVIEYRGKGHFLPYDDHRIIGDWLKQCESADSLLLVLSDLIPEFYGKTRTSSHPPSLSRLDVKVRNILKARSSRHKFSDADKEAQFLASSEETHLENQDG